jgi:hypothetical protein
MSEKTPSVDSVRDALFLADNDSPVTVRIAGVTHRIRSIEVQRVFGATTSERAVIVAGVKVSDD